MSHTPYYYAPGGKYVLFLDLLGFTAFVRSSFQKKAEETDDREKEFELAQKQFKIAQAEVDREYRRFHEHLEELLRRPSRRGKSPAMSLVFSDCAYVVFDRPKDAERFAVHAMRSFIRNDMPGLVTSVDFGGGERGLTLTRKGRDLLVSHTLERDGETQQAFHAGVGRPHELDHDSNLYPTFCQEEARLRDEHPDLEIRRVILEQDLKREYQEFLQDHNRNRSDSDGRPDRGEDEIRDWAREHDLPYFDGQVHFPDYRIEYEVDGREHHEDVELFTPHYRGAHAASRGKTGFRIYIVASRGTGGRSRPHPRIMEEFL